MTSRRAPQAVNSPGREDQGEVPERDTTAPKRETPFDDIEGALEYVSLLLETVREAQKEVETEIGRAASPQKARQKQALQIVSHKLASLSSHMVVSQRMLNDLRTLRRLLLKERTPGGQRT